VKESIESGFFSSDDEVTSKPKYERRKMELKTLIVAAIEDGREQRDPRRTFSSELKTPLYEKQNGKCALCQQTMDENRLEEPNYVHIDHIIPHRKGGPTDLSNAQLTHRACNLQKGAGSSDSTV
jgi:CRISPR/Cas system Type II protein with McrA/HNH and RuvC-like nuclease domain